MTGTEFNVIDPRLLTMVAMVGLIVFLSLSYVFLGGDWVLSGGLAYFSGMLAYQVFLPNYDREFLGAVTPYVRLSAAQVLLQLQILPLAVGYYQRSFHLPLPVIVNGFLGLNAVWILLGFPAFFTGQSFDTALMVVCAPLVLGYLGKRRPSLFHWEYLSLLAQFVAIITFKGATAFVVLCGILFVFVLRKRWYLLSAASFSAMLGAYYLLKDTPFLYDSGRFVLWQTHMDWWFSNVRSLFGAGIGSYEWIGPFVPVNGISYFWMHNDFLQLFFEGGVVGLTVGLIVYGRALWLSRMSNEVFYTLVGLGFCMLFYSPLHVILIQLILASFFEVLSRPSYSVFKHLKRIN